jgi:hypothetical protein
MNDLADSHLADDLSPDLLADAIVVNRSDTGDRSVQSSTFLLRPQSGLAVRLGVDCTEFSLGTVTRTDLPSISITQQKSMKNFTYNSSPVNWRFVGWLASVRFVDLLTRAP